MGKSALVNQFIQNYFVDDCYSTNDGCYYKQVVIDGENCCLEIRDTVGQELYPPRDPPIDSYIRKGDGFLLVLNLNNPASFSGISKYRGQVIRVRDEKEVFILVTPLL